MQTGSGTGLCTDSVCDPLVIKVSKDWGICSVREWGAGCCADDGSIGGFGKGSSAIGFPGETGNLPELGVSGPKSESLLLDICGDKVFSEDLSLLPLSFPLIVSCPSCPDKLRDLSLSLVADPASPSDSSLLSLLSSLLSFFGSFDDPARNFGSGICM
jgi:hypothetical protein